MKALPLAMGLDKDTVIVLDALHKQRNFGDYQGNPVTNAAVAECLKRAEALLAHTRQWLAKQRPDLLAKT